MNKYTPILFAIMCLLDGLASVLFDTSLNLYQNYSGKQCTILPKVSNLVWPEGLLYSWSRKKITDHNSEDLSMEYPLDESLSMRWPPI